MTNIPSNQMNPSGVESYEVGEVRRDWPHSQRVVLLEDYEALNVCLEECGHELREAQAEIARLRKGAHETPAEVPYLDSVRLEWLFRHISGAEWRRLGVTTSAGMNRTLLNDAMVIAESAVKTPAHPDPTGKTREPPHCPTCGCVTWTEQPAVVGRRFEAPLPPEPGTDSSGTRSCKHPNTGVGTGLRERCPDCGELV